MGEAKIILVVDDDESVVELFKLYAKKYAVKCIFAGNGAEAMLKIQNQKFDYVITDLRMPKMDGIKFIKTVRGLPDYKNFPFIVTTASLNSFAPEIALLDKIFVRGLQDNQVD